MKAHILRRAQRLLPLEQRAAVWPRPTAVQQIGSPIPAKYFDASFLTLSQLSVS